VSLLGRFEARDEREGSQRFQRRLAARLLEALSEMGVNTADVLSYCGGPTDTHLTTQGWPAFAFWEAAVAVSGESGIGVRLAESVGPEDFGLLGGLVSNSATLGEALLHGLRLSRLSLTTAQIGVYSDGENTCIALTSARPAALHNEEIDFIMASGVLAARALTRKPVIPVEVSLAHEAPLDRSHHRRVFRGPLRFGGTQTACTLPTALLLSPLPNSDARLLLSLTDKVEQRAGASSVEFCQQVQAEILAELRSGDPSIKRVASRLKTYPHTVTRKLKVAGLSYRELLVRTRFELASQYLQRAGTRMTTIADMLGYSNKSAFIRAFTRRAGCSPTEYRRRVRGQLAEQ
jgi:AraC-like DNA-binding protein